MKKKILLTLFSLNVTFCAYSQQATSEIQMQSPSNPGKYQQNPSETYWSGTIEGLNKPGQEDPGVAVQVQQTLSIIKPDAVKKNHVGEIIARFEKSGLRIAAIKMTK